MNKPTISERGKPITIAYKGHVIEIEWDLDWHVKVDGNRRGTFLTMDAAETAAKKTIDQIEKDNKPAVKKKR